MRARHRVAEQLDELLLDVRGDRVLPAVRLAVHLLPLEPDHVDEQTLREPVPAHDRGREPAALGRELDGVVLAQLGVAGVAQPVDRLRDRGGRDAEPLDQARAQRRRALFLDLEDRLEVFLGRVMHLGHGAQVTLTFMSSPRDATPVVAARALTKAYGSVVAVDDVELDVRPGELLALLGPSGCGKTTTLRLLAGFERPDAGEIRLNGNAGRGEWDIRAARRSAASASSSRTSRCSRT